MNVVLQIPEQSHRVIVMATMEQESQLSKSGAWIQSLLDMNGWTLEKLAAGADTAPGVISNIRAGNRNLTASMAKRLAESATEGMADSVKRAVLEEGLAAAAADRGYVPDETPPLRDPVDLAAAKYLRSIGASDNFETDYTEEEKEQLREGIEITIAGWVAQRHRKRNEERRRKGKGQ